MPDKKKKGTPVSEEIKEEEILEQAEESSETAEEEPQKSDAADVIEKKQYDELYDKYLRTLAEYDNFKKRTQKEKEELYGMGVSEAVEKLLPVADNLERALLALDEAEKNQFSEGVQMVYKQFFEIQSTY